MTFSPMTIERLEETSVNYFLQNVFASMSFIHVTTEYPNEEFTSPSVVIGWDNLNESRFEIGSDNFALSRLWYVDIFAQTNQQKKDIIYLVTDSIKPGIPVYNYNEGFPPSVTPSLVGVTEISRISATNIQIDPRMVSELFYRGTVYFDTVLNKVF